MKKLYLLSIVILSSLFTSCDKFEDNVHFNDLIGTWGVQSYMIEGRPSLFPPDERISFYENYEYVEIANNELGDGSIGGFSFNDNTNDLVYNGKTYRVETLDWYTFRVTFLNNAGRRSEMTYRRVPENNISPAQANLIGRWEQRTTDAYYFLYFYANGDFIDIQENRYNGSTLAKFGHYELEGRNLVNIFFGKSFNSLPIMDIKPNTLTLFFASEGNITYTRSF